MDAKNKVNFIKDWIQDYVDKMPMKAQSLVCLLYTSDAADE